MRGVKLVAMAIPAAMAMLVLPVGAMAQVGPNPAVSGGSLDPTMGASRDPMTAPQDSPAELPGGAPAVDLRTRGASDDDGAGVRAGGDAKVTTDGAAPDMTTPDRAAATTVKGKSAKARMRRPR